MFTVKFVYSVLGRFSKMSYTICCEELTIFGVGNCTIQDSISTVTTNIMLYTRLTNSITLETSSWTYFTHQNCVVLNIRYSPKCHTCNPCHIRSTSQGVLVPGFWRSRYFLQIKINCVIHFAVSSSFTERNSNNPSSGSLHFCSHLLIELFIGIFYSILHPLFRKKLKTNQLDFFV